MGLQIECGYCITMSPLIKGFNILIRGGWMNTVMVRPDKPVTVRPDKPV